LVEAPFVEGQLIRQGSVMARLDDSIIQAALQQARMQQMQSEAALVAAEQAERDARPIFERNQKQAAVGAISAQMFDEARSAYNAAASESIVRRRAVEVARASVQQAMKALDDTVVRAPFTGVLTARAAQIGEIVSPVSAGGGFTRTGIGTLVDMQSLEVEVDVGERYIGQIHVGQESSVTLNAYPEWQIPANVTAIIPTADRAKATVKVRVGFKQIDPKILPEMGARVAFQMADGSPGKAAASGNAGTVSILKSSVEQSSGKQFVYVLQDGKVSKKAVSVEFETPDGELLVGGIAPGTRVVSDNLSGLRDGMRVDVRN
jgi:RND family efflux transporter MFP subunit